MNEGVERTDNPLEPHTDDLVKQLQLIWSQSLFWFTMTHGSWDNFVHCPSARMPIVVKFGRQNGDSHKPEPEWWGKAQYWRFKTSWEHMTARSHVRDCQSEDCRLGNHRCLSCGWANLLQAYPGGNRCVFFKQRKPFSNAVWLDALNMIHSYLSLEFYMAMTSFDMTVKLEQGFCIESQVEMNHQKRGRRPVPKLSGLHRFAVLEFHECVFISTKWWQYQYNTIHLRLCCSLLYMHGQGRILRMT